MTEDKDMTTPKTSTTPGKEISEEASSLEASEEFVCTVCGRVCKNESGLKSHMRSHEKPVKENAEEEKSASSKEEVAMTREMLKEIQDSIDNLKKKNKFLESVADKRQVARWYARNKKDLPVHVKLRTWDEKVIIGWRTVRDEGVIRNIQTGRWIETQDIEIVLEDGKKIEMPYMAWVLRYSHVECKKVGEEVDDNGNVSLKLKRLDNGKEYTVEVQFVN